MKTGLFNFNDSLGLRWLDYAVIHLASAISYLPDFSIRLHRCGLPASRRFFLPSRNGWLVGAHQ